jgi:hypothetical protein
VHNEYENGGYKIQKETFCDFPEGWPLLSPQTMRGQLLALTVFRRDSLEPLWKSQP